MQDWCIISSEQAKGELDNVESRRREVEGNLDKTDTHAKLTAHRVRAIAMQAWGMISSVMEMAGISISATSRAAVTGAIQISTMLYQLASAEAITPGLALKAAFTYGQAIAAYYQARTLESEGKETAAQVNQALSSMNMMIGGFHL
jgi:hypothetical protein